MPRKKPQEQRTVSCLGAAHHVLVHGCQVWSWGGCLWYAQMQGLGVGWGCSNCLQCCICASWEQNKAIIMIPCTSKQLPYIVGHRASAIACMQDACIVEYIQAPHLPANFWVWVRHAVSKLVARFDEDEVRTGSNVVQSTSQLVPVPLQTYPAAWGSQQMPMPGVVLN